MENSSKHIALSSLSLSTGLDEDDLSLKLKRMSKDVALRPILVFLHKGNPYIVS